MNTKRNKYLMNLEKKFNPAVAKYNTRMINLWEESEDNQKVLVLITNLNQNDHIVELIFIT